MRRTLRHDPDGGPHRWPGIAICGMLVALLLVPGYLGANAGAAEEPTEAEVKVLFVLNFIKFVEWPSTAFPSREHPVVLSVLGSDPVADAIEGLQGKTVAGRKLQVRKPANLASLERSHLLFVGASARGELGAVLHAVRPWSTLTIADIEGFASRGGVIGFVRQGDRVGFEINEEAARKAELQISAKLLYLGRSVRTRQGAER